MSHAQEALQILLSNIPPFEFSTDDQRSTFEAIRQRLTASADMESELKALYKVHNFSDFAAALLWIADRAEKGGGSQTGAEETSLVLSTFRTAMGDTASPMGSESLVPDSDNPLAEFGEGSPVPPDAVLPFSGDEKQFSALLDQFVEAMQSGEEARVPLLGQVVAACSIVGAGEFAGDYKEYCGSLMEFLTYISENQFLDDVRVMNLLSNVSSPVSQWANTAPGEREGLLEEGIAPLRDFKSLFE
jgi:hypothetical protein